MELLSKRFEALNPQSAGPFEFEENITIGIHRGPSHIDLDDNVDIPVSYAFNPKTFKMLHPKKYYEKTIFDRDEVKAFRHDDVLDEEAYVEKRTISVKPVAKQRKGEPSEKLDFRVSRRSDHEDHEDRRMVRSQPSR